MTAQKILICMHDFFRGGTERVAIGLAASWVDAGRDVTILCGSDEGGLRDRLDVRVKVICLDPPVRRSVFSRIRLARRMGWHVAALKPDVIFLPGNYHALLSGGLGAVAAAPIAPGGAPIPLPQPGHRVSGSRCRCERGRRPPPERWGRHRTLQGTHGPRTTLSFPRKSGHR